MKKPPQFISHNVYYKTKNITRHNREETINSNLLQDDSAVIVSRQKF